MRKTLFTTQATATVVVAAKKRKTIKMDNKNKNDFVPDQNNRQYH